MAKDEAVAWLYGNFSKFDFSMKPATLKYDFTDKQFLTWCAKKKDFQRKNCNHSEWATFQQCIQDIFAHNEKLKVEKEEKTVLSNIIHRMKHLPPVLQTFSIVEIAEQQQRHTIPLSHYINSNTSISDVMVNFEKLRQDFPDASFFEEGEAYEQSYWVINTGYESFEKAKKRLEEKAKKEYEDHLASYTRYLELIKKYPDLKPLEGDLDYHFGPH